MRYKFIAVVLLLSVAFFGCKKKKEVQIVGTWIEIPPAVQPETYQYKWIISEDNRIEVMNYEVIHTEAEYSLSYKFPRFYVDIDSLVYHGGNFGGRYRIDELDDEILKMTRIEYPDGSTGGAFYRFEFLRE